MKEKTKELADSVGAVYPTLLLGRHDGVLFTETELETFVELIRAAEREACAEVCKKHADVYEKVEQNPTAKSAWAACIDNRDAIRARKNT